MRKIDSYFPLWGPYGKKYMGISRIADEEMMRGIRFDFTASPTVFASGVRVPNTTVPCGARAWQCLEDYSFYSYRFDMEGRDDVYSVVTYIKLNDEATLVRSEIFNNTDLIQNCLVNYFSSVEYRFDSFCDLKLPKKNIYIDATDYEEYSYAIKRPWDEQNADARKKGEFLDNRFCFGKGLGDRAEKWHIPHRYLAPFGGEKGDRVLYRLNNTAEFENPVLTVRYRTSGIEYRRGEMTGVRYIPGTERAVFSLNGERIVFEPTDDMKTVSFPLKSVPEKLELVSLGGGGIEFDFFAVTEKGETVSVSERMNPVVPEINTEKNSVGYTVRMKYEGLDGEYILRTFDDNTRFRRINTGCLEDCMSARLSNSDESFDDLTASFTASFKRKHSDNGFFQNTLVHTLFVPAHSSRVCLAVISHGEEKYLTQEEYEKLYRKRAGEYKRLCFNSQGEKYALSNELLKSAVLTNVVYPIYKHGRFIIHHTPGKRWDCLYTWDSGFIGLGFMYYAPKFAEYILNTYLSSQSNKDYAFVHHGSPVPVQFYIFLEMMNRDKSCIAVYYDRLKLYYDFYLGKIRGSTTAKFKSGLLTTYDYFYSSSGMDDYPAQVKMMNDDIRDTAAPVITSSQAIRCAKIMLAAAAEIGRINDTEVYLSDIERLTEALNKYSWDSDSGYFSYVLHDKNYNPVCKYMLPSGENLNKGLDGIYPIISGICNGEQKKAILSHLKNEKEMLSPYGISAVDMTASYFKVNGYWNGNVWFSHQWFIFKTALDLGESDLAFEIAHRALNIWKRECEHLYYTFEMVNVVTGRGGWFHNFGGLSTPVNMWAFSYYKPGTVTVGFDTLIDNCCLNTDNTELNLKITKHTDEKSTVLICLDDKYGYKAECNGSTASYLSRFPGEIEISLPECTGEYNIFVKKL